MKSKPRFRAVLFDLDGTLADSYAAITASVDGSVEWQQPAVRNPSWKDAYVCFSWETRETP